MKSNYIRWMMIGALLVSLASVGAGAAAAAPAGTSSPTAEAGTATVADDADCAGTVCETACDVAEKLGKEVNCVTSASSGDLRIAVVAVDGVDCAGSVCQAACEVGEKLEHCVMSTSTSDGGVAVVAATGTECVTCVADCLDRNIERIGEQGVTDVVKNPQEYLTCPA